MFLDTSGAGAGCTLPEGAIAFDVLRQEYVFAAPVSAVPPPFMPWPKIPRLSKEVVATEKLDGTNSQVEITEDRQIFAGSRTRWLKPGKQTDNFGFAAWVEENRDELIEGLGVGRHYGEWWGRGIQSGYGLSERRFSLFNVGRWRSRHVAEPERLLDPGSVYAPACCHVVPTLYRGHFSTPALEDIIEELRLDGSVAAPGFCKPEGIIVFHTGASQMFKKFLVNDETPKGTLH